jgi:hypothetical protein
VRALPAADEEGRPFEGPGVDLRGDAAAAAFAAAAPVLAWFTAREPGVRLRSLSMEIGTGRVLATIKPDALGLAPPHALRAPKARLVRVDPRASVELLEAARPLLAYLGTATREVLRRRTKSTTK